MKETEFTKHSMQVPVIKICLAQIDKAKNFDDREGDHNERKALLELVFVAAVPLLNPCWIVFCPDTSVRQSS